jgi:hypothetical protein
MQCAVHPANTHATCFGLCCIIMYCTLTANWTAPSCSVLCTYTQSAFTEISEIEIQYCMALTPLEDRYVVIRLAVV